MCRVPYKLSVSLEDQSVIFFFDVPLFSLKRFCVTVVAVAIAVGVGGNVFFLLEVPALLQVQCLNDFAAFVDVRRKKY